MICSVSVYTDMVFAKTDLPDLAPACLNATCVTRPAAGTGLINAASAGTVMAAATSVLMLQGGCPW